MSTRKSGGELRCSQCDTWQPRGDIAKRITISVTGQRNRVRLYLCRDCFAGRDRTKTLLDVMKSILMAGLKRMGVGS